MESSDPLLRSLRGVRQMPSEQGTAGSVSRFDHARYVSSTMEFRCNLKCVHCMIADTMDRLAPQASHQLRSLLEHNAAHGQWTGLILTGSEITLNRDLPEWVRMARRHGFEHVRIQTHGMRLADAAYCAELIDAGVDEFFVSIAAADAATHDAITRVPGSFDKMMRGLELLDQHERVSTITNTVVTALSYTHLPALVELLRGLKRLVQMEFWFYFPMSENDDKALLVSHVAALPFLKNAIVAARGYGLGLEVKNFPECLLGEDRAALYNDQPTLFIDPAFWTEFARNGFYQCVHRDVCRSSQCLGLNSAYIRKFGDQAGLLKPLASA